MKFKIPGTCYSEKINVPARNAPVARCVFPEINGFPYLRSKDLSNAKDDAMVGVYPLECIKPAIRFEIFGKSRNPNPNPQSEKAWKSKTMTSPTSPE